MVEMRATVTHVGMKKSVLSALMIPKSITAAGVREVSYISSTI